MEIDRRRARLPVGGARSGADQSRSSSSKPGRTEGAAKAAASHTGSLTGSDEVLEVAFRRSGVLRVEQHRRTVLHGRSARQAAAPEGPAPDHPHQRRRSRRAGHRRADHRWRRTGDAFPRDDGSIQRTPARRLEPQQPGRHPGRCQPERYAKALEIAAKDPNSDGMLVILTPQAMTDPTQDRRRIDSRTRSRSASRSSPPGWAATMWLRAKRILNKANIPTFPYPDTAARVSSITWRITPRTCAACTKRPCPLARTRTSEMDRERAARSSTGVREPGRTILTEVRIEATAGLLRHSDRGDAHRKERRTKR